MQYHEYDYFIFQRGIEMINWNKYVINYNICNKLFEYYFC